jgi:pfkB family carbohydrate kinase
MKILVIGHSVVDKIVTSDKFITKPGGIFYTISALNAIKSANDEIFLCTYSSSEYCKLFDPVYSRINSELIFEKDEIPVVHLHTSQTCERDEHYKNIVSELPVEKISFNKFDAVMINMITGFDITLKQMEFIRQNFKGLIYFDVHTFSRGLDEHLHRNFRVIPDFEKWIECIDILQANETEIKFVLPFQREKVNIQKLFLSGMKQVIVTRSEKGATVFFKEGNEIREINQQAIKTKAINKVGCGDIFGAFYFYNYIRSKSIKDSLKQAVKAAGISTTFNEFTDFSRLKDDISKGFY